MQHSSGVCLVANTLFDEIVKPTLSGITFTDKDVKLIKRLMTLSLGLISILYANGFRMAKNTLLSLLFLFNNSTNAPMLGLFLLSVLNPYANWFGALIGFLCNLGLNYWFASGAIMIIKERPSKIALCNNNSALYNYENFDFGNLSYTHTSIPSLSINTSKAHDFYLKNHPGIHFIFSMVI